MRKPRSIDELLVWVLVAIACELFIIIFAITVMVLFPAPASL